MTDPTNINIPDDETISSLVRSVQYTLPGSLDREVNTLLVQANREKRIFKPVFWYPITAAASLAIMLIFTLFQPFWQENNTGAPKENLNSSPAPITEIKTEFDLPQSNIKIVWVQKKDFKLRS